jgi:hypothetical protein
MKPDQACENFRRNNETMTYHQNLLSTSDKSHRGLISSIAISTMRRGREVGEKVTGKRNKFMALCCLIKAKFG